MADDDKTSDEEITGETEQPEEFHVQQFDWDDGRTTYVRRIAVEGGWLYQTLDGSIGLEEWSPPVFVPRPPAPTWEQLLNMPLGSKPD